MSELVPVQKVQYCLICKYNLKEEHKLKASSREVLFLYNNRHFPLYLCYRHSVEYFLKGQVSFLQKYNTIIHDFCSQVDDPIREYLTRLEASLDVRKKSSWWKGDWFTD